MSLPPKVDPNNLAKWFDDMFAWIDGERSTIRWNKACNTVADVAEGSAALRQLVETDRLWPAYREHLDGVRYRGLTRSSKWPKLREDHLKLHPSCAACGRIVALNVHHIKPFHLYPGAELDPGNLLTLCEGPTMNCHLWFGHLGAWVYYNPAVLIMVAPMLVAVREVRAKPAPMKAAFTSTPKDVDNPVARWWREFVEHQDTVPTVLAEEWSAGDHVMDSDEVRGAGEDASTGENPG